MSIQNTIDNQLASDLAKYDLEMVWLSIDLARLDKEKNLIDFKDKENNSITKVFIRKSYLQIFDIIKNNKQNYYIGGNPGIGKTKFIHYIAYYLWDMGIDFAFESVHCKGESFYFYRNEQNKPLVNCEYGKNIKGALVNNSRCNGIWYISDTMVPLYTRFKTILISSPRPKASKEFLKFSPQPKTITMPLWSLRELYEINNAIFKMDEDVLNNNYYLWGGVPFKIFEGATIQDFLNSIGKCDYALDIDSIGSSDSHPNVTHNLFHLSVDENDPTFTKTFLVFASTFAKELIIFKNVTKLKVPLESFFKGDILSIKKMGGEIYESYVLRVLGNGGTFTLKLIENPSITTKIEISKTPVTFSKMEDILVSDKLYIPRSESFPAFDAVLTRGVLFQVTMSSNCQPLPAESVKSLVSHLSKVHKGCQTLKALVVTVTPYETGVTPLKYSKPGTTVSNFESSQNIEQWFLHVPSPVAEELKNFQPSIPKSILDHFNVQDSFE